MKYTIGRHKDNNLVLDDPTVSGKHAEIRISQNFEDFTLVDLQSANGTKVNNRNIATKKILEKDTYQFGDSKISGENLFGPLKTFVKSSRTDFSKEFAELLKLEAQYKSKRRSLNKNYRLLAMLPRLLITIGIVLIIYLIPNLGAELRYPLMITATLVGSTISTLGISERKKEELLDKLKTKFQLEFVCPKCGSEFYGKEGFYWKEKKSCRNNKCNATWHVN